MKAYGSFHHVNPSRRGDRYNFKVPSPRQGDEPGFVSQLLRTLDERTRVFQNAAVFLTDNVHMRQFQRQHFRRRAISIMRWHGIRRTAHDGSQCFATHADAVGTPDIGKWRQGKDRLDRLRRGELQRA